MAKHSKRPTKTYLNTTYMRTRYPIVHFIHIAAIMPPTMEPDAINIASFCQKSKLPAKKAKKSTMKASQPAPIITVPAVLDPNEFMATTLPNELISF